MLMLLSIVLPFVTGGALLFLRPENRTVRRNYIMLSSTATMILALAAIITAEGNEPIVLLRMSGILSISFKIDGLGAIFGGMASILWPIACLYADEYMTKEGAPFRFFSLYLISFGVTLGIAFSANILTMYLFYELLTLSTLPLVMHSMDGMARYAGRVYLVYSMAGASLGFVCMVFVLHYGMAFFRFGGMVASMGTSMNMLLPAYVLGFFGFGVKAAVFPGHSWLLRASVAPTPVTALLHAVAVVKAGVFAVTRITWYCFGPDLLRGTWAQWVVMGASAFTIVYGSSQALRTRHLKRRLAWSTVSNLSYILLGVTTLTTEGLVASQCHMLFHAVIKITLFFAAGALHYKLHKDFVPEIEGYGPLSPIVFTTFTVAALGLMGVPPLAGFSSKWMLATSAAGTGTPMGYIGAAALIASAILTALYLMQVVMLAWLPRENRRLTGRVRWRDAQDPNWCMTVPLTILALASVALGLGAQYVVKFVQTMLQI